MICVRVEGDELVVRIPIGKGFMEFTLCKYPDIPSEVSAKVVTVGCWDTVRYGVVCEYKVVIPCDEYYGVSQYPHEYRAFRQGKKWFVLHYKRYNDPESFGELGVRPVNSKEEAIKYLVSKVVEPPMHVVFET